MREDINKIYLINTSNNLLARYLFYIKNILLLQNYIIILSNDIIDFNYFEVYIVINEIIISIIYNKLDIKLIKLSKSKLL